MLFGDEQVFLIKDLNCFNYFWRIDLLTSSSFDNIRHAASVWFTLTTVCVALFGVLRVQEYLNLLDTHRKKELELEL